MHEDTAARVEKYGAEKLAYDFKRRADQMRSLADRIEAPPPL